MNSQTKKIPPKQPRSQKPFAKKFLEGDEKLKEGLILLEYRLVCSLAYNCKKQRAYCFLYRCFTHDERNADG